MTFAFFVFCMLLYTDFPISLCNSYMVSRHFENVILSSVIRASSTNQIVRNATVALKFMQKVGRLAWLIIYK